MDFKEARERLKKLANGEYYSMQFHLTEYSSGELKPECSLYLPDPGWVKGPNWETALFKLQIEMGLIPEDKILEMIEGADKVIIRNDATGEEGEASEEIAEQYK